MKTKKDTDRASHDDSASRKRKRTTNSNEEENICPSSKSSRSKSSNPIQLKSVFSRVLKDVTNIPDSSRDQTQSQRLSFTSATTYSPAASTDKAKGKRVQSSKSILTNSDMSCLISNQSSCSTSPITNLPYLSKVLPSASKYRETLHCTTDENLNSEDLPYDDSSEGASEEAYDEQIFDCSSQESDTNSSSSDIDEDLSVEPHTHQQKAQLLDMMETLLQNVFRDVNLEKGGSLKRKRHYIDEGDPTYKCEHCGAIMWYGERINKKQRSRKPTFSLCCGQGQVTLPLLKESPELLKNLLTKDDELSKYFRENIRLINMLFSFTSLGGKVDRSVPNGHGPQMFQLQGENYHRIGSLKPNLGDIAKFSQLYIIDTENEIDDRASIISKYKKPGEKAKKQLLQRKLIESIIKMLDDVNPYVQKFRSARERFQINPDQSFHMRIVSTREKDGRTYDRPTASEVAALIPGDFNLDMDKRDIVLQRRQTGFLKRISEVHVSYLPLQYPLIFTYGEDGFRLGIKKRTTVKTAKLKRTDISMRQWFAFRLQEREKECHTLLHCKRLFQQFLVDAYTSIEASRLRYLKLNQKSLRSDSYDSIKQSENAGKVDMHDQGNKFILPASFTGGPRYMKNNYLDAMAICKHFGFPDLFITFTCNPKWPEITRYLNKRKLKPDDRPDIICRIFKMKLDSLMSDLTDKHLLGETVASMYTIEFQKRGLPHAHILLFMHAKSKFPTTDHIDKIISAEIPETCVNGQLSLCLMMGRS